MVENRTNLYMHVVHVWNLQLEIEIYFLIYSILQLNLDQFLNYEHGSVQLAPQMLEVLIIVYINEKPCETES